jgi:hypothetical protein
MKRSTCVVALVVTACLQAVGCSEPGPVASPVTWIAPDVYAASQSAAKAHREFLRAIQPRQVTETGRSVSPTDLREACRQFFGAGGRADPRGCDIPLPLVGYFRRAASLGASQEAVEMYEAQLEDLMDDGLTTAQLASAADGIFNDVLSDPEIDEEESNGFYIAMGVAIDSYDYWQQSSSWDPYYEEAETTLAKIPWLTCIVGTFAMGAISDSAGGFAGFFAAGPTGIVSGAGWASGFAAGWAITSLCHG